MYGHANLDVCLDRIREIGAGRPPLKKTEVIELFDKVMKQDTASDPMGRQKLCGGNVRVRVRPSSRAASWLAREWRTP